MEILEEQKKEGILQTAGCMKLVSVIIVVKGQAPHVLSVIKQLCLFVFCSLQGMRMQVQIQQHAPPPFLRRTVV